MRETMKKVSITPDVTGTVIQYQISKPTLKGLPILAGKESVANHCMVPTHVLSYFQHNKYGHSHSMGGVTAYKKFTIRKKDGSKRVLVSPNQILKVYQRWLLDNIISKIPISPIAMGFVKGLSYIDVARMHTNKKLVISIDIHNFFGSVPYSKLLKIFKKETGYSGEISHYLLDLCQLNGFLPQGSPASPALANLYMKNADEEIINAFPGWTITRYADDVTLSTTDSTDVDPISVVETLRNILKKYRLKLNDRKTKIMYADERQVVMGLVVNKKVNPLRRKYKNLRASIHNVVTKQDYGRDYKDDPAGWLRHTKGVMANLRRVNPDKAAKLEDEFAVAQEIVENYLSQYHAPVQLEDTTNSNTTQTTV